MPRLSLCIVARMWWGELIGRLREWLRDPAHNPALGDVWEKRTNDGGYRTWTVVGFDERTRVATLQDGGSTCHTRIYVMAALDLMRLVRKRA